MNRLGLAAAGAAVVGLTACGHSTAPNAGPAAHRAGTPIAPVSCSQQYHAWAKGEGKSVMIALRGVSSAAKAGNGHALNAALRQAKPAVAKATKHPIPACADRRGYWTVVLMHVNAAASGKGPASSVRAATQAVPALMSHLAAGVKQTTR